MEVGVFRLGNEFFAYENRCPHLEGPVCQGKILPLALEAVAGDGTSSGRVFSKTADERRLSVARLRVRYPHRHAPDRSASVRLRKLPVRVIDGEGLCDGAGCGVVVMDCGREPTGADLEN